MNLNKIKNKIFVAALMSLFIVSTAQTAFAMEDLDNIDLPTEVLNLYTGQTVIVQSSTSMYADDGFLTRHDGHGQVQVWTPDDVDEGYPSRSSQLASTKECSKQDYYVDKEGGGYTDYWVANNANGTGNMSYIGDGGINCNYYYVNDAQQSYDPDNGRGYTNVDQNQYMKLNNVNSSRNGYAFNLSGRSDPNAENDSGTIFELNVSGEQFDSHRQEALWPNKYDDVIIDSKTQLATAMPQLAEYDSTTYELPSGVNGTTIRQMPQYANDNYFNKLQIDSNLDEKLFTNASSYTRPYIRNGNAYVFNNVQALGLLCRNINLSETGIENLSVYKGHKKGSGNNGEYDDPTITDSAYSSGQYVSLDKTNWKYIATSNAYDASYNMFTQQLIFDDGQIVSVKDTLGVSEVTSFYVRRQEGLYGTFSPARHIRTKLEFEDAVMYYDGDPVVLHQQADPAHVIIGAKWTDDENWVYGHLERKSSDKSYEYYNIVWDGVYNSDANHHKTTPITLYGSSGPAQKDCGFITVVNGMCVFAVGEENIAQWYFQDGRAVGSKSGTFTIPGIEPDVVHMTAKYDADSVSAGLEYDPSNVSITTYYQVADGESPMYRTVKGNYYQVGLTMYNELQNGTTFEKGTPTSVVDYIVGDTDSNGVINTADLTYLNTYFKNPKIITGEASVIPAEDMVQSDQTTTAAQRLAEFKKRADINGDGAIDDKDKALLTEILNKKTVDYADYIKTAALDDSDSAKYVAKGGTFYYFASYVKYTDTKKYNGTSYANLTAKLNNNVSSKGNSVKLSDTTVDFHDRYVPFAVTSHDRIPVGLSIASMPKKVNYIENEDFDTNGLALLVRYDNGTTKTLSWNDDEFSTVNLWDNRNSAGGNTKSLTTNITKITAQYTESGKTFSASIPITVTAHQLSGVMVTTGSDRVYYDSGTKFDQTGMVVKAWFDNIGSENINDQTYEKEKKVITLTADQYKIRRNSEADGTSKTKKIISLNGQPDQVIIKADKYSDFKSTYGYAVIKGTSIISNTITDLNGHGTVTYKNGSLVQTVTGTYVGNDYIVISYTYGATTKYDWQPVYVGPKVLSSITLSGSPYKKDYVVGDAFNPDGVAVTAVYSDNSTAAVPARTDLSNGYYLVSTDTKNPNKLSLGMTEIMFGYQETYANRNAQSKTLTFAGLDDTVTTTAKISGISVTSADVVNVEAIYLGPNVQVGSYIQTKTSSHSGYVRVTVTYKNGTTDVFDATADQIHYADSDILGTKITTEGENKFYVLFSGFKAPFTVNGVKRETVEDFSSSTATSKRTNATQTEVFTATKIRTVNDYIQGYINNNYYVRQDNGTVTQAEDTKELSTIEMSAQTDTRAILNAASGTEKPDTGEQKSPLLSFVREGVNREYSTNVTIRYRAHTRGFLYPNQTALPTDNGDAYNFNTALSYFNSEGTNTSKYGQSDWVNNGDTTGTDGQRIAFDYNLTTRENPEAKDTFVDALQIRLDNLQDGETAGLIIQYQDINGTWQNAAESATRFGKVYTLTNPVAVKIGLTGTVKVVKSVDYAGNATYEFKNFADVYKIFYRAGDNDLIQQSQGNADMNAAEQMVSNVAGKTINVMEIKMMLQSASFNKESSMSAPVIDDVPKDTTVFVGNKASFTVRAIGDSLTYQWYKATSDMSNKNGTAIAGATTANYITDATSITDNGSQYYCIVTAANGSFSTTPTAELTVTRAMPVIMNNPALSFKIDSETKVLTGLTAESGDAMKDIAYQQQISGSDGNWMNIDNMNTGTLTIVTGTKTASPTLTRHASINGKYLRCVVTALDPNNSWLTKKKYSATIQIDCKMPPTVTITTAKKYVTESTVGIEFRASAYTANVTTLRYRWYLDGASVGTNSTTYTYIPDTTGTHVIRCEALDQTMASEADGMGYDEMMVYVGKAPAITDLTYETVDYVTTLTPTIQSYDTQNLTYEQYLNGEKQADQTGSTAKFDGLGAQSVIMLSVKDNFGTAKETITVLGSSNVPLKILTQPSNVSGKNNAVVSTSIKARGSGLTYKWQYKEIGGTKWIDTDYAGHDTSTLTFTIDDESVNRIFHCIVTDSSGDTVTSTGISVTKLSTLAITTQPVNLFGETGKMVTASISATGKSLTYQWQQSTDGTTQENSTYSGAATQSMTITVESASVASEFRCIVTDSTGDSLTSNTITITNSIPLVITSQPSSLYGTAGTDVTATVAATGSKVSYQWQYQIIGETTWTDSTYSGNNTDTLTINVNDESVARKYRCHISDDQGKTIDSDEITVEKYVTLSITTQPTDITGISKTTAKASVTAEGSGLTYQWQYLPSSSSTWVDVGTGTAGYNTASLSIYIDSISADRKYRCVVTDSKGNTVTSNSITVTEIVAFQITKQPVDLTDYDGNTVTAVVNADGTGLTYKQEFTSGTSGKWYTSDYSGYNTESLSIPVNALSASRKYRCTITNDNGDSLVTNTISVTKKTVLSIVLQPVNVAGSLGSNVAANVTVAGDGLTYQQQFKGSADTDYSDSAYTGNTSSELTIPVDTTSMDGTFRCIINDQYGSTVTTDAITVTQGTPLLITAQPEDIVDYKDVTKTASVTATGNGLTYQWQYKANGSDTWADSGFLGNATDSLSIKIDDTTVGKQFHCVISDSEGKSIITNAITVSYATSIEIMAQPLSVTGSADDSALISINVIGDEVTYEWQYAETSSTTQTSASGVYDGYNSDVLEITINTETTGRKFRCVATDKYGHSVTSDEVTVTIG